MIQQAELPYQLQDTQDQAEVDSLLILLASIRGWVSAKSLTAITGNNERKIRALASASKGRVLSAPGSPGYTHTRSATPAEVDHYTSALLRQADDMRQRAIDIRRVFYRGDT